jgi:hypothetical protein
MAMSRVQLTLIVLGMAFAVPALTGAKVAPLTAPAQETACAPQPDPDDSNRRWFWRLRAYRHLDCIHAIANRALESTSSDRVELSRTDLERLRAEAQYARDAAARIEP